jgi:hypothetical protein
MRQIGLPPTSIEDESKHKPCDNQTKAPKQFVHIVQKSTNADKSITQLTSIKFAIEGPKSAKSNDGIA